MRAQERRNPTRRVDRQKRIRVKLNIWKTTKCLCFLALYVNVFNSPIKRHTVNDRIEKKKKDSTDCCLQETHHTSKEILTLTAKG
jgi:hypothetical protein